MSLKTTLASSFRSGGACSEGLSSNLDRRTPRLSPTSVHRSPLSFGSDVEGKVDAMPRRAATEMRIYLAIILILFTNADLIGAFQMLQSCNAKQVSWESEERHCTLQRGSRIQIPFPRTHYCSA